MSEYETIQIQQDGAVEWLTLNRPEALNSINTQMVTDLRDYFGQKMEDTNTRVIVMRGEGRAYCAGLDIKQAGNMVDSSGHRPVGQGWGFQGYLAEVYIRMRRCPQPIVSLIQGPACGGGFAFVLASDIRIAAENARMNAAFIRIGLSACDMGTSYFLPRLVGTALASELMLTGKFIDAQRALSTGLVSEVVPQEQLLDAAQSYIRVMLTTPPMEIRLTKEGLNMAIDASNLEAAMAIENRNQILCSNTEDAKEGMRAFVEKRDPVYQGK